MSEPKTSIETFNSALKQTVRFAMSSGGRLMDMVVSRRLNLFLNEAPNAGLEIVGPYLIKYRGFIRANATDFFQEFNLLEDWKPEYDDSKEEIATMMKAFSDIYTSGSAADKTEMGKKMNLLLAMALELCEFEISDNDEYDDAEDEVDAEINALDLSKATIK